MKLFDRDQFKLPFKIFLSVLLVISLTGLSKQPKNDRNLKGKIINKHIETMFKTYGFRVDGTGGSGPVEIRGVFISYVSTMKVDVNTARKVYVNAVEKLVNMINNEKKIRPYLHDYPCNFRTAEVDLAFITKDDDFISEKDKLAFVYVKNDKIYYDICNPETGRLIDFYSEPYEEALRIVKSESKALNDK